MNKPGKSITHATKKKDFISFLSSFLKFLQFVTKEDYLTTIKNECMKYYEEKYINEQIIQVLDKY